MSEHKPFVPPEARIRELSAVALIVGALFGIVFAASSVYLGLKVGLTVSASIPVAVLAITFVPRRGPDDGTPFGMLGLGGRVDDPSKVKEDRQGERRQHRRIRVGRALHPQQGPKPVETNQESHDPAADPAAEDDCSLDRLSADSKEGDTVFWLTDDACRVPVEIRSKILIGSLVSELVEYSNPACPLRLKSGTRKE